MEFNKILEGNAFRRAIDIPEGSISMIMTSPPYWGLRDYKTEPQIWGGNDECKHNWVGYRVKGQSGGISSKLNIKGQENFQRVPDAVVMNCTKCFAMKCELGRESHPSLFVHNLCDVFEALKPCLADWGSLYVNLGDTYYGGGQGIGSNLNKDRSQPLKPTARGKGFPAKSLVGIPAMFQLEMCNRGWLLRNTIIWHKPAPMPTSARDRFTIDFEYVFFFVKQKNYWYRQYLEDAKEQNPLCNHKFGGNKAPGYGNLNYSGKDYVPKSIDGKVKRNKRTTWDINTASFKGKHFAVYPLELCEVPIYCSCPDRICTKCGKPVSYKRVTKSVVTRLVKFGNKNAKRQYASAPERNITVDFGVQEVKCDCNAEFVPGIVLDPFFGRGTTGKAALLQEKRFLGIELLKKNIDIADEYLRSELPYYDREEDDVCEV